MRPRRRHRSRARRTSYVVATITVLVLVVASGSAALTPTAPGATARFKGRLTADRPASRHVVTVPAGKLTATLRLDSDVRVSLSLRDSTGALLDRSRGTGPLRVSARLAAGKYRFRITTSSPLRRRDISYTLRTASTPSSTDDAICGTWVLYQVSSVTDLTRLRSHIEDALALPGVVGFSVRFPWDAADMTGNQTTHPLLDKAADIAADSGKALSIRFMAGAHTPQRVFDAGAASYLIKGSQVPLPWSNATGSHQVFLDAYRDYVAKLAAWSTAHDVRLLHLSWYGQDWAELNHGAEVRAAAGYSEKTWLAGHEQLIDVGAELAGDDLTVELPLSGYGPLSGGQSAALADHISERMGTHADQFAIQANGWDETREWGSPSASVEADFDKTWNKPLPTRGLQMIQPDGYHWAKVYDRLDAADALYAEVYLPSFWQTPGPTAQYNHNSPTRIARLEREIAAFSKQRCN